LDQPGAAEICPDADHVFAAILTVMLRGNRVFVTLYAAKTN
jgi:hypothetical protein